MSYGSRAPSRQASLCANKDYSLLIQIIRTTSELSGHSIRRDTLVLRPAVSRSRINIYKHLIACKRSKARGNARATAGRYTSECHVSEFPMYRTQPDQLALVRSSELEVMS